MVADVAAAIRGDLLVGQDGAKCGAPVHGFVGQVGQPPAVDDRRAARRRSAPPTAGRRGSAARRTSNSAISSATGLATPGALVAPAAKDPAEDPLCPPVVPRVAGGELPACVVAQAEPAQLVAHDRDVRLGGDPGMLARVDRELLGRQPERVVADRRAAHACRSSAGTWRRRRSRGSRADGRRAARCRSGRRTCRARTSAACRRRARSPAPSARPDWATRTCRRPPSGAASAPRSRPRAPRHTGMGRRCPRRFACAAVHGFVAIHSWASQKSRELSRKSKNPSRRRGEPHGKGSARLVGKEASGGEHVGRIAPIGPFSRSEGCNRLPFGAVPFTADEATWSDPFAAVCLRRALCLR